MSRHVSVAAAFFLGPPTRSFRIDRRSPNYIDRLPSSVVDRKCAEWDEKEGCHGFQEMNPCIRFLVSRQRNARPSRGRLYPSPTLSLLCA